MKALIELYIQQFKTTLAMMFQYRASLIIWTAGQILEPLVYLIVWSAVASGTGGSVGDYTAADFAAYFIVLMLVNQVTFTWIMYEFEYRVRHGTFSATLLKPVHPIHSDIADNVMSKVITLPIVGLVAVILMRAFNASISTPFWAVLVFIPALFLAFLVRFFLEWTLAQTAFWTTRVSAINQTYFVALLFLSGQIAPLALMPAPIQVVSYIMPFRWLLSFPVELISGRVSATGAAIGIGAQFAWLAVSVVLLRFVWRRGVKTYTAVGA
ncbi:MAG: ABC-2 family transporter protein [Dehalococcoidales bacterium]|nr:ABC-2 family transporter protein [Dehalococcoidales bacterium]